MRRAGSSEGFTLIELLMVVAIMGVLASMCVAGLLSARSSANEASAIGSMRALNSAQSAYNSTCGGGHYATTFPILVNGKFASPDMALSPKSGFTFALAAGAAGAASSNDCTGQATQTRYLGTATPLASGWGTARRSFATSESGTVWEIFGSTAPSEPFGADGAMPIN